MDKVACNIWRVNPKRGFETGSIRSTIVIVFQRVRISGRRRFRVRRSPPLTPASALFRLFIIRLALRLDGTFDGSFWSLGFEFGWLHPLPKSVDLNPCCHRMHPCRVTARSTQGYFEMTIQSRNRSFRQGPAFSVSTKCL